MTKRTNNSVAKNSPSSCKSKAFESFVAPTQGPTWNAKPYLRPSRSSLSPDHVPSKYIPIVLVFPHHSISVGFDFIPIFANIPSSLAGCTDMLLSISSLFLFGCALSALPNLSSFLSNMCAILACATASETSVHYQYYYHLSLSKSLSTTGCPAASKTC